MEKKEIELQILLCQLFQHVDNGVSNDLLPRRGTPLQFHTGNQKSLAQLNTVFVTGAWVQGTCTNQGYQKHQRTVLTCSIKKRDFSTKM